MSQKITYQLLSDYLSGKLSKAESESLEARISSDPKLVAELEEVRLAQLISIEAALAEKKAEFSKFDYDRLDRKIKFKRALPWIFGSVLLISLLLFIFIPDKVEVNEKPMKELSRVETQNQHHVPTYSTNTTSTVQAEELPKNPIYSKADAITPIDTIDNPFTSDSGKVLFQSKSDTTKLTQDETTKGIDSSKTIVNSPKRCKFLVVDINNSPSCHNDDNGEIRITSEENTNVRYQLPGHSENKNGVFKGLSPGIYDIKIDYADGCDTTITNLEVGEKYCPQYNYIHFKSSGSDLEMDIAKTGSGIAYIYNRSGQLVKELKFNQDDVVIWTLKNTEGKPVANGIFKLIVKYDEGFTKSGEITITE